MSARQAGNGTAGGGGGRAALTALLLVAAALAMMLLARATPDVEPFDPRSGGASGTRGMVLLLEEVGASVRVVSDVPAASDGERVVVLRADLSDVQGARLRQFVADGGVVVWADPANDLFTEAGSAGSLPSVDWSPSDTDFNVPLGDCDLAALDHLRGLLAPSGELLNVGGDDVACFGDAQPSITGEGAFVVASPHGDGWVVRLGDNEGFTNRWLRYADNGPLATALLAPRPGAKVAVLLGDGRAPATERAEVTEQESLLDLVRPSVWMALAQLAIAFVAVAVAIGVRPGRPVREPAQVPLAGSELVLANGRLMHRAGHADRAAQWLRSEAYRRMCSEHHLPPTTSVEQLDAAIAVHTPALAGRVAEVLSREVYGPDDLLRLSADLHDVHTASSPAIPSADATHQRETNIPQQGATS